MGIDFKFAFRFIASLVVIKHRLVQRANNQLIPNKHNGSILVRANVILILN